MKKLSNFTSYHMKNLISYAIASIASLVFAVGLLNAAPQHGHGHGGHGHGHSGHGHGHHGHHGHHGGHGHHGHGLHHHGHGPHHNLGKSWHGKNFKHWCFDHGWFGWTKEYFYPELDEYIYWAPDEGCWYQYVEPDEIYVPLENLTDVDLDKGEAEVVPPVVVPPVVVPPVVTPPSH